MPENPPPHPWQYLTASLVADGPGGSGMGLTSETLEADPQAPSGWRRQLDQRHYRGISQLPAIWYASHGAAFGEGELPHLRLAHQYLNHFRCQGYYQELLYRTALPVGVRTGVVGPMGHGTSDPVVHAPRCPDPGCLPGLGAAAEPGDPEGLDVFFSAAALVRHHR